MFVLKQHAINSVIIITEGGVLFVNEGEKLQWEHTGLSGNLWPPYYSSATNASSLVIVPLKNLTKAMDLLPRT